MSAKARRRLGLVGLSLQPLWLGLVLSWVFGDELGWFPPGGYCDTLGPEPDCGGPLPWAYHMVLPWTTFALIYGAVYVRLVRGRSRETLARRPRAHRPCQGGVRMGSPALARAAGDASGRCSPRSCSTSAVMAFGLIGATLFVEVAFGIPGLGRTHGAGRRRAATSRC